MDRTKDEVVSTGADVVPVPVIESEVELTVEVWLRDAVGKVTICVDSVPVVVRVEVIDSDWVTEAVLVIVDPVAVFVRVDSVTDSVNDSETVLVNVDWVAVLVADWVRVTVWDSVNDAVSVSETETVTDAVLVRVAETVGDASETDSVSVTLGTETVPVTDWVLVREAVGRTPLEVTTRLVTDSDSTSEVLWVAAGTEVVPVAKIDSVKSGTSVETVTAVRAGALVL